MEEIGSNVSRNKKGLVYLIIIYLFLSLSLYTSAASAKNLALRAPAGSLQTNRFKLELSLLAGVGTDKKDLFITNTNETLTLSAGGGVGGALTFGYLLSSNLDIDLTFGFQKSELSQKVSNASASFDRNFLLGTLKYKISLGNAGQIKIGAGLGVYMPGEWDVDGSQVPPSYSHTIIEYDNAYGFHISAEYEYLFSTKWSLGAGLRYYNVSYKANSWKEDNLQISLEGLNNELRDLDGSGFDFIFYIAKYF